VWASTLTLAIGMSVMFVIGLGAFLLYQPPALSDAVSSRAGN